jgi:hypothetical protein
MYRPEAAVSLPGTAGFVLGWQGGIHRQGGKMTAQETGSAAAVRAVMETYVQAVYKADVETLRKLFHPAALMSGYLGDTLLAGSPEPFLADVGGRQSMEAAGAPYQAQILDIQAGPRAAALRLEETGFFGVTSFVNFFHLLKVDGEWLIVSKTFESL